MLGPRRSHDATDVLGQRPSAATLLRHPFLNTPEAKDTKTLLKAIREAGGEIAAPAASPHKSCADGPASLTLCQVVYPALAHVCGCPCEERLQCLCSCLQ